MGRKNGVLPSIYFMAAIGAGVYYIQHADNFMQGVIGVLKAIVWPGILAHRIFEMLAL